MAMVITMVLEAINLIKATTR